MEDTNNTPRRKLRQLTAKQQHDILQKTFTEDSYAFTEAWEDGAAFRAELEQFHRNMAPEEAAGDRRRLAMAAYYFGFQPGMFDYAYDNFEQFSNKANGGKQLDAWADFDRVAQSFGVQQAKPEESQPGFFAGIGNYAAAASMMRPEYMVAANAAGISPEKQKQEFKKAAAEGDRAFANWETQALPAAWKQDLTRLSGTVYNFLGALGREYAKHSTANIRAELSRTAPGAVDLIRKPDEAANIAGNMIRSPYVNRLEGARDNAAFVLANTGVPENWVSNSGSVSNWFRNFGVAVIGSLPSTIANLGLAATGGPAAFGVVYGADGYYQALDEGMSEEMAIGYGATIGLINGVGEIVTSKLLKVGGDKVNIQALQRDIARSVVSRVARHLTVGGLKEGGQEAAEQTAENLADMMFGRRGKITTNNWKSELFRNVPEAFANAFATGFALEAVNYKAKQSFNEYKLREYQNLERIRSTIAELENKSGELSADEAELLQVLNIMNDAADPAKIARGAEMIQIYEVRHTIDQVRQREAQNAPDMNDGTMAAENETEAIERSPEEQKQSDDAARELKLQRLLPHDPQDTENAVLDTMEKLGYTGEVVVMKTGWDEELLQLMRGKVPELADLPADLEKSVLGKMFPAFYHNGKVYINAQTVRPSEVSRILAHEAGLHEGIRKAFSKDLNTLLDWVFDANFNTPELDRIIANYHLAEAEVDEEGNPLFDGEGNQILKELSEENRRIAAEELLADLAETGGMDYRKVYLDNEADITAFAKENNIDIHNLADRRQLVKDWVSATGYTVQKPNWFKQLISNIRIWMHNHGLPVKNLSDDDIANIIFRSAKAARSQRRSMEDKRTGTDRSDNSDYSDKSDGNGARFMTVPQEETAAFKNWFADSKVVDADGKPLVVYHQTGNDFTVFDLDKQSHSKGDYETPIGIFLKPDDKDIGFKGKKQMALYVKISNPKVFFNRAGIKQFAMNNKQYENLILTIEDNDRKYHQLTEEIDKELTDFYIQWRKKKFAGKLEFENIDADPEYQKLTKREDKIFEEWGKKNDALGNQARRILSDMLKREGHDGIVIKEDAGSFGRKTITYIAFSPTQVKSATDNIGTFDPNNPDVRFTLNGNASEELKRQVKAMQACVGPFLDQDGAEYARRFKEKYGISIDPDEAKVIAALAISENKSAHQKKVAADNAVRAWSYFKSFNPLFDFIVEFAGDDFKINPGMAFAGDDFKINPGMAFAGDEFTGTFITPEYRKYSVKRRQKPNESDAAYRKYLAKREKALAKVSGTPLDEVAQAYARESGRELKDVQEEIIDLLRNLQRTDIISQYKKYKDDQIAADNAELEALRRATEDQQRRRIEEEAATVIQSQSVIDADWAKANSKVYIKLQELLFPGQSPTPHPSQSRIEEINAAIYSTKGDASGFIEGFRAGREAAYNKYAKELKAFREKLRSADADRVAAAREADALLRKLLPPEHYSKFARRVIGLRDITNEKARLEAFDKLKSDILAYADIVARDRNLEQFHTRLNQLGRRSDTGRKAIGVRDEATQRQLDQIRQYALMSAAELAELVDGLQAKIENSENNTADEEISLHLALQFGAIDGKNLQEIITAREQLEELARNGKEKFNAALSARAAADEAMRQQIIIAVNGNNAVKSPFERQKRKNAEATQSKFAGYIKAGVWENLNLWGMFDLLDANSLGVFDKLAADTHTAARNEDSINFRNADDLSRKINSLIGSNSPIERAGRILQWRKIEDKSGVFRLKHKDNAKRRFKYTYYELSQARYLLEEYDKNPSESILQDYQAEAIRHQLANFDNHVRKDYKSSFNDGVTEKLEKLAAEEEQKRAYDGKSEESLVCIPTPDFSEAQRGEMPLSQMQALSLWLYSKQPTVNYKLHFNGIDNNTLKQLENFLLPEVKELGKWMVKQLEDDRAEIGKVYEKLYFTAFPSEENYFPAVFEHVKTVGGRNSVDITQEGAGAKPMAYTPGALKQRVFHLGEPVTADALTVFQNHRMMMNHFVTHGETTRQLRAIFNNHDVRQTIVDQHGTLAYKSLVDQLEAFVQGGNINADANRFYQAVYGAWVRSKMAGNVVSGIKQALGFITYGQEIPAAALAKGSIYALRHPGEALEVLKSSDYFNNRLRGGANAELRLLLDMSGQTAGRIKAWARRFDEMLSYALRYGDAASVFLGGYATYKYHFDNLVARGVEEDQARKQALLEMEMATERTQQSSKPHMLNAAQRSSLRAFTAFKSNQILLMNKLLPAILKRDGKQIKASLGTLAVSSIVMTAVGNLLRKGIDFDEYEWLDYIENFAADAMSGYGFSGALGSEIIGGILSEIKNKKFRFRGSDPLTDIGNTVFSITDMPEHLEDEDYDKVFGDVQKILTGVGMVADAVTPGNFVSNTAAVVREARRWWRLLTGANKRKPKRKKSWL